MVNKTYASVATRLHPAAPRERRLVIGERDQHVRKLEALPARGQRRGPVGLTRAVRGGIGVDDSDQYLGHDPAADGSEPLTVASVLGLAQDVEPERCLAAPSRGAKRCLVRVEWRLAH